MNSAELEFKSTTGLVLGRLSIFAPSNQVDSLFNIGEAEAERFCEEPIQICEAVSYEFQLIATNSEWTIRIASSVVGLKMSRNPNLSCCGVINTGSYVGRLELELITTTGDVLSVLAVEVRSKKISYRDDFRKMIELISSHSMDLLFDFRSPTTVKQTHIEGSISSSYYQKIIFLKGTLASKVFKDALLFIISRPNELLKKEVMSKNIRLGAKPTSKTLRDIASAVKRTCIPLSHPLSRRVNSLPENLNYPSVVLSQNTPENQFVKFVLESFIDYLSTVDRQITALEDNKYLRISAELKFLIKDLESFLNNRLFAKVSRMSSIPLSSQVLQRREGYREILNTWLKFDLAMQISWSSGEDLFYGGQKNVALLYEYWVFFELISILKEFCSFTDDIILNVFEVSQDKLSLKLKQGKNISFKGQSNSNYGHFHVRFDYNRSFKHVSSFSLPGSWSRPMRPDYSLSFWPLEHTEDSAEATGSMVRLHFDAKYRVDSYDSIFSESALDIEDDVDFNDQKEPKLAEDTYKRDDLLKMHAYKDAIRRSFGAYVLYPGSSDYNVQGYHEVLPGVGAFVMRPGNDSKYFKTFMKDIFSHLNDTSSARLDVSLYTAKAYNRNN